MRAQRPGPAGRLRRKREHRRAVVRLLGVVRQPCRIDLAVGLAQRRQQRTVEVSPAGRAEVGLDRDPGKLMAEADAVALSVSIPPARHSSRAVAAPPQTASITAGSSAGGATETASSTDRASGLMRAARAYTASLTVAGTSPPPASSTSCT